MKNLLTISVLIFVVLFNSCKKEEDSNTDKLCGKYWVITEATVDPSVPIVDEYGNIMGYTNNIFAQIEPCNKDDVEKYNSDGTLIWDVRVKCDINEAQSGNGTWVFNSDETVLTETVGNESYSYTIIELSGSKFKYNYEMTMYGVAYNLTITCVPEE
jgi:hypothetical protein